MDCGIDVDFRPVVHKNFINESERLELLDHANNMELFVNKIGAPYGTRNFRRIDGTDLANQLIQDLFNRIANKLGLTNPIIDPKLGQIVSVIKPNGFIHEHTDLYMNAKLKDKHNLRFNIMVDRGNDISYNPIIDDKVYEVGKRDAWCFGASIYKHKTETIKGPENRVVYQFGFIV